MRMTGEHIKTKKWIFHLMTFAFFWLVIGDLIVLHQKVIYGFDPFNHHIPFAKTSNSPVKTKTDKGSKVEKSKDQFHFDTALKSEVNFRTVLNVCEIELINTYLDRVSQYSIPGISLRAPPFC